MVAEFDLVVRVEVETCPFLVGLPPDQLHRRQPLDQPGDLQPLLRVAERVNPEAAAGLAGDAEDAERLHHRATALGQFFAGPERLRRQRQLAAGPGDRSFKGAVLLLVDLHVRNRTLQRRQAEELGQPAAEAFERRILSLVRRPADLAQPLAARRDQGQRLA